MCGIGQFDVWVWKTIGLANIVLSAIHHWFPVMGLDVRTRAVRRLAPSIISFPVMGLDVGLGQFDVWFGEPFSLANVVLSAIIISFYIMDLDVGPE
ncbi:hypothetical protein AVEN_100102-1 [Araneus ventricosus]|uniref:Uncharacterized protein n=1 Tax=Araneus ventricosus TaxID=182803 RepID=A0A4Y2JCG4_ARAVE|nr:hypothetical protein AVEN_100102-1 [Araneus ventricosus]